MAVAGGGAPRESIVMSHRANILSKSEKEIALLTKGSIRVTRDQFERVRLEDMPADIE